MTKMKVTDAAKQMGAGAKELLEKIAGTRKGTGDTLAQLRKLEEQLVAKEAKAREEAERVREEQERQKAEADRIAAANAQEEALRAAVIAERDRARKENEAAAAPAKEEPAAQQAAQPAQAPAAQQRPQQQGQRNDRPQQGDRRPQQGDRRNQRPGFTPRPFVPNPNDPNALVNRQNPNFVAPQGAQQGERRPFGRDGQQGERRPFGRDGQQGERRPFNRDGQQQGERRPFGRDGQQGGPRPFVPRDKDKDADAPQRRSQPQRPSRPKAPELLPVMEKERVSNYDPNKNNYNRQHDPEKKAQKPKKQIMKENVRAAGGLDDEWRRSKKPKKNQQAAPKPEPIKIEKAYMTAEKITVKDLSERIGKPVAELIKKLLLLGIFATINQELDYDTALLVCSEYDIELEMKMEKTSEEALMEINEDVDKEEDLLPRPPVVTIMGHVDHGKTSLLDCIRRTHVTAGEAGGITQHIGAYTAEIHDQQITFLDTPGHEAFTSMRMRGAQCTDIVVLVVAADDGIMPQTVEAINHSKAAGVPIIVAINKMDKPTANPDRVKQELTEHELVPEDWGGDVICEPVSAHTEFGIEALLEDILLTAEMKELKANPNRPARGTIVEARLDKGRGPVATLLVQAGTIHVGDPIVAGTAFGRVRAMVNDKGQRINEAGPSMPVEIIGFNDVPDAGDTLYVTSDERLARQVAEERHDKERAAQIKAMQKTTLDDLFSQMKEGEVKDLNIIIKADVQGSVEAVRQSLEKLSNDEVRVRSIHGGVGAINESDIMLATSSNAIVIGFNVRPDAKARAMAEREGVDMRMYRIIYDAIEEVKAAMKGMLAPKFKEVILGHAEIRNTFRVSGVGTVAGCMVTDGLVRRNGKVRLLRDNIVIFEGNLDSLKRFKDDAREVNAGYECGIGLEGYNDMKELDVIECFIMEEIEK